MIQMIHIYSASLFMFLLIASAKKTPSSCHKLGQFCKRRLISSVLICLEVTKRIISVLHNVSKEGALFYVSPISSILPSAVSFLCNSAVPNCSMTIQRLVFSSAVTDANILSGTGGSSPCRFVSCVLVWTARQHLPAGQLQLCPEADDLLRWEWGGGGGQPTS